MKIFILFTFIISGSSYAENSRSPAVLDGTCNTDVPTTISAMIDGKEVVSERSVSDILKDQCKAVKKCMYSADEKDMDELKSLEAVVCNNNMNAVTTKTPGIVVEKNFDGKRKAKFDPKDLPAQTSGQTLTPSVVPK